MNKTKNYLALLLFCNIFFVCKTLGSESTESKELLGSSASSLDSLSDYIAPFTSDRYQRYYPEDDEFPKTVEIKVRKKHEMMDVSLEIGICRAVIIKSVKKTVPNKFGYYMRSHPSDKPFQGYYYLSKKGFEVYQEPQTGQYYIDKKV